MKNLILLFLIVPFLIRAQSSINVNYNGVYVGNNVSLDFDYQIDKFLLSIGAAYYPGVNKDKVSFGTFNKDRGSPSNFKQHFGLQFNIGYRIYGNNHFDLFGIYKGCFASMDTYFRFFQTYNPIVPEPQVIEDYAVTIHDHEFGPVFSFDNTFGLLFKGKITSGLYINLHGGVGFTYLKNNDEFVYTASSHGSSQLSTTFSIGLGYSFKNAKFDSK